MAEARSREAWNHTSAVLALLANIHRHPKKSKAFKPSDFNPYEMKRGSGVPLRADNIGLLKQVFVKGSGRERAPGCGKFFWRAQAVVAPGFMPGGRWRRRPPGCAGDNAGDKPRRYGQAAANRPMPQIVATPGHPDG